MATCNARTDERGSIVSVKSLVVSHATRLGDIVDKHPMGDGFNFELKKIGDLLDVKSNPLHILLNFVMREYKVHAGVKVRYTYQGSRHYVKIRGRIWTCFNGQIKRHLVK